MIAENPHARHQDSAPALKFVRAEFAYAGRPVFREVSFGVDAPGLTVLIGPNGGGKTTLLKLALGLLPPRSGTVRVFGSPPHRACSLVGYVPQQPLLNPDFPVTVEEVVGMGCAGVHRWGGHRNRCHGAIHQALETVGLSELKHRSFSALSGGERQRVLIARALAGEPKLLLLDEPAAGVDPAFARRLGDLLVRLSRTLAVVAVSHDLGFAGLPAAQTFFVDGTVRKMSPEELEGGLLWRLYRPEGVES